MTLHDCNAVRGRPRLPGDEVERRKAAALDMLRAGATHREVVLATKLDSWQVSAVAKANAIPPRPKGRKPTPEAVARTAERRAAALAMLRAGATRDAVRIATKLHASVIAALGREHAIPKVVPQRRPRDLARHITRLSHAELDALEKTIRDRA